MFGENRDSAARAQGFGVGLLIGALVGAGAALLLAPATGNETRKLLRRGAKRVYARGGDVLHDGWDDAERRARRLAKQGMRRGRQVLEKL
jgi:gas vesicle protein